MEDRLVGVKDLEARYGPPTSWWYTAAEGRKIPSYKIGKYLRFKLGEVEAWIAAQKREPK
jgi:predicted DNA-binding transcriptional regulator AlpA